MSVHVKHFAGRSSAWLLLVGYTLISLLPLYLMVISSLMRIGSDFDASRMQFIPTSPSFDNYVSFNERVQGYLPRYLMNSMIVATIPTITSVFFGVMAGYALSKMRFPGRETIFWIIIATMAIPHFVILIPLYEMIWSFYWIDTYAALVVPTMAGIASVFLARQYLVTLPTALLESGRLDGCGELALFWHVVLPLARPLLAVLAIMSFVIMWTDYFWAYLVTNSRPIYTIQMGIIGVLGVDAGWAGEIDYGEIMAAATLASLPVIAVFLAAQRFFVQGLTIGAVKG